MISSLNILSKRESIYLILITFFNKVYILLSHVSVFTIHENFWGIQKMTEIKIPTRKNSLSKTPRTRGNRAIIISTRKSIVRKTLIVFVTLRIKNIIVKTIRNVHGI